MWWWLALAVILLLGYMEASYRRYVKGCVLLETLARQAGYRTCTWCNTPWENVERNKQGVHVCYPPRNRGRAA